MKVTLNWLRRYVDFNWPPDELRERLTMAGLEVEGMQKLGGEFEGIVVAQILTRDKVPGSDKLSVCRVNDGQRERTIICGAQNHKPGDKVALILPNYALPLKAGEKEPFVIKERKVFGIVSQGMMCSPQELGLPDDVDGLLILPGDANVGQSFAEYLGRAGGDVVYDLEVTPNRPDWNSVIGIAREIAAITGHPLRISEIQDHESAAANLAADLVAVRIEDADLCPRYTARVVRGVKIGPSPDWLRSTLEKVGVRSINNVVDVTNYVMMETGQPLHAFDYHLIARAGNGKPTIVVRRAQSGELFVTLDGQKRTLSDEMLLIADEQKGIALAGIMGGQNTEINDQTSDVLIESAYFKPTNIRRTSKALGLRSESSYRFERGADIGITERASRRAAQLILETAGGELVMGVVDAFPKPTDPVAITLRHEKVGALLGVEIADSEQNQLLKRLGLESAEVAPAGQKRISAFRVPTFRVDLKREVDLIEEIGRLHGVEKIPTTPPRGAIGSNAFDALHDELAEARRLLTGLGLSEAQGQTLISDTATRLTKSEAIALRNPLSSDMNMLRPSLLPGLLDALRQNVNHKSSDVALFEIGRVFAPTESLPREERRLAIALTGLRNPSFWGNESHTSDLHDLKGVLEDFLEHFGVRGLSYAHSAEDTSLFVEAATIQLGRQTIGELGQVLPTVAKRHDLRDAVLLAELNLDLLLARRSRTRNFKALPGYPAIRRDVAMLVPESITHEAVLSAARQARSPDLESVELFDVFRGKDVPDGQKSVAYAFTYRSLERTLTDVEVNTAHEKLVGQLKQSLRATIR